MTCKPADTSGWNVRPLYDASKRRADLTFAQTLWVAAFGIACLLFMWPWALVVMHFALAVALIAGLLWLVCWPFRAMSRRRHA